MQREPGLDQKLGTKPAERKAGPQPQMKMVTTATSYDWAGTGKAPMDPPIRTPRVCDCKEAEAIGKLPERWKDS